MVKALRKFRVHLLGRPFLLRTDHSALRWLRLTPAPFGQQGRWMVEIEDFDFEIEHRAGKNTTMPTPYLADHVGSVFSARKT